MADSADQGLLLVGTFEQAIFALDRDRGTGALAGARQVASVPKASYLAHDAGKRRLYAVSEQADGSLVAFRLSAGGTLERLNDQPAGAGPTHLSLHPNGRWLLSAHYGGGTISVHPLDDDGRLGPPSLLAHEGSGPNPQRQREPHPHMIVPSPDGRWVLVADLGTDEVITYALDESAGRLRREQVARLRPGAGPRHLVFHSSGHVFVAGELDSTVTVFAYEPQDGSLRAVGEPVSTLIDPQLGGDNFPGAIRLSPDERHLYVSNRGRDTVAVFGVRGPELAPVDESPCGGDHPRDMIFAGRAFYVANVRSNNVALFEHDPDSGRLSGPRQSVELPGAAGVLPL